MGEFIAGEQLDFVLHARVVRNDDAPARIVAKEPNDRGMSPADDLDDAAFGAACRGEAAEARDFGDDGVAVHSVFYMIARDKDVAVHVGQSHIRDHETEAILMKDQAALDFVARGGFVLRKFLGWFGEDVSRLLGGCGGLWRLVGEKAPA